MKLCLGNWKMNGRREAVIEFIDACVANDMINRENVGFAIPAVYVDAALSIKGRFNIGAQDISQFGSDGAFTGENSAQMFVDLGCTFALIAHSERRNYFSESNEIISRKIINCRNAKLRTVVCIGETLEEREREKTINVLDSQINDISSALKLLADKELILAYEPVWAIGTGKVASMDDIKKVHTHLHSKLGSDFPGAKIKLLYGGSVKSSNAKEILDLDCVQGVLVGGASLNVDEFAKICQYI